MNLIFFVKNILFECKQNLVEQLIQRVQHKKTLDLKQIAK